MKRVGTSWRWRDVAGRWWIAHSTCVESWAFSFEEAISTALGSLGDCANPEQLALFRGHFEAILLANESVNLTRITDPQEAAIKHYVDSLAILAWTRTRNVSPPLEVERLTILDVGTGAGFPAVPIAVMRPEWQVTALDGTRKKVEFVERVSRDLGLENVKVEHGHSDHWVTAETFDVVTTRAVASLAQCMRTSLRFMKKGGRLIAYKTAALSNEEMAEARQACGELGMELEPPFLYELALNAEKMARALYPVRRDF